ncbi:MAG TPA: aldehyde dehydrogenase [Gemmatimonadetes bacterium]|nr:aldehyde dehydrogenase [Gemmatimonadota bacterium]
MPTLKSYNPATGTVMGEVPITNPGDIPEMVKKSRNAQPSWDQLGHHARNKLLVDAYRDIQSQTERLASLITREMGKPFREGLIEAESLGSHLEEELREIELAVVPETYRDEKSLSTVYRDPLGVCAAITPWNFPLSMPSWMVIPALSTGNVVLLKPSEETPLCGQAFVDILNAHLPKDVLNVIHGADEQGKKLVESNVDLIAFTGSRETGKDILRSASRTFKRVVLEMGGKDPMIILEDAHLEKAARFAAFNSFRNSGQVCVSTERIFVPEKIAEQFEALLVETVEGLELGDGMKETTTLGPMVNSRQRDHVLGQIDDAVTEGAEILLGGDGHKDNFVKPTVLTNVTESMSIASDETFGPVACVTRVASVDEAIRKANSTPFGLGAAVFGENEEETSRIARQLNAGMVGINQGVAPCVRGTPWIGARESGYGFHKSKDGHRQFTQTRVVTKRF